MPHDDRPFRWEDLDQPLIAPKVSAVAERMHKQAAQEERRIGHEAAQSGNAAGYISRLFDFHEKQADEWAAADYAAHCEAWQEQGRTVSPAFIRAVRDNVIIPLIVTRKATVQWKVSFRGDRIHQPPSATALGEWAHRMDRLASNWSSRLEAEAVAAEYTRADQPQQLPVAVASAPSGFAKDD